jgi:hypothetical protein
MGKLNIVHDGFLMDKIEAGGVHGAIEALPR